MTTKYTELKQFARFARSYLKLDLPFIYRRIKFENGDLGSCLKDDDYYLIQIDSRIPCWFAIFILIHELAHAVSWEIQPCQDHGIMWGKAYSKVYKIYLAWLEYQYGEDE